jgi:WhiB family redox-sensing transcriptional regulator
VEWQERALCRTWIASSPGDPGRSPELWFPENRRAGDARRAKAFCRVCPVMDRCLREALKDAETRGIWGGLDEDERAALHKRGRLQLAG